ncbi:MAG: SGNH/GDSL hydrolase family protein [Deltaproteobacteria bacterium]|nr:SGNH/GDSL hydrolase family protein [Deltaproteobacteria bacterium]
MRRSVALQQQTRDSIEEELAARIRIHQQRIARLKIARARTAAAGAPPQPLVMLAHGDSWFDYPLSGNSLSLEDTDVIAHLRTMGNLNPIILNVSHYSDSSTDEMSWPKQRLMIDALQDPANWMATGQPDAILFSGGGNDVAGDQFCIYLNSAPAASSLNLERFELALDGVEASYLDLLAFRDHYAPDVPVFAHCYDFAIPNGRHPDCVGPWLKPSFDFNGWHNLAENTATVQQVLTLFKEMLAALAQDASKNFNLIDTQGVLVPDDWANELHPFPSGFGKIAGRFVNALREKFPSRI